MSKPTITCDCGCVVGKYYFKKHLLTNKHNKLMLKKTVEAAADSVKFVVEFDDEGNKKMIYKIFLSKSIHNSERAGIFHYAIGDDMCDKFHNWVSEDVCEHPLEYLSGYMEQKIHNYIQNRLPKVKFQDCRFLFDMIDSVMECNGDEERFDDFLENYSGEYNEGYYYPDSDDDDYDEDNIFEKKIKWTEYDGLKAKIIATYCELENIEKINADDALKAIYKTVYRYGDFNTLAFNDELHEEVYDDAEYLERVLNEINEDTTFSYKVIFTD